MGYSNPRISHETPIHLRGRSDGSTEVLPLHRKTAQQTSPETRAVRFGRRNHGRNGGFMRPKMVISCDLHHGLATKLRFRTELIGKIWENIIVDPGLNFYYGVENPFCTKASKFLTSAIIKWWFSTPRGLRKMTTWYCYKMKIVFYHEVTWRGNSTTTKWRLIFIIKLLEGDTPPLQNEDWFLYAFIIRLLEGNTSILQNEDWFLLSSYLKGTLHHYKWKLVFIFFIIRLLEGNTSQGQLPLLQNEIGFLHVVFRWANSLAIKWVSIFKGLSTTEMLTTYKMQFPSCGYKMPGPSQFFHLNLSLESPWNGAQGLPFCSWNSNGDNCCI